MFKFDQTLMNFVRKDVDQGLIPMLLGEPGIGKSSWLMALANLMHTKCFVLACNQLADKADLTGARLVPCEVEVVNADGTTSTQTTYKQVFYPHAVIHDAIEYAKNNPRETPILFMDELNRTTPDVTSEALSIPTLRAIGSTALPANLRVVIAGNDKGNITVLDEASVSRFVLYHVEPDTQTFLGLDPNLNIFVKNVLTAHPEVIFGKTLPSVTTAKTNDDDDDEKVAIEEVLDEGDEMLQITTPRTISGLSRWLNTFDNQEMLQALSNVYVVDGEETNALKEGIEGHVGKTAFAAMLMNEIASKIMTINTQANALTVPKPACYDAMKACPDVTSLNQMVSTMTDNDKSGCMVYLLYEKADNTAFINALAPMVNTILRDDMKTLSALVQQEQLDPGNVAVLLNSKTPITQSIGAWLGMFYNT